MNFGFVINNRTCIGCHACSTACKSENDVPLGVYRTWVKYTERGTYPDTTRSFQVTRCNHCANPPCVRICPVTAMYQRSDGIVEFDGDQCIGCKACMQACPYDAIHIDPNTGTAAKCHYCSHRTDIGLEPACVVVCPEHSIIAGDIDDPESEISKVLAKEKVTVRKPEQGTAPKVFYVDGDDIAMHPTATERTPETYMWADVVPLHGEKHEHAEQPMVAAGGGGRVRTAPSGASIRKPGKQGAPARGPIQIGGRVAEHMVQVGYNAQHKIPWHWPVPAYLVTKAIGAGLFMFMALGIFSGWFSHHRLTMVVSGAVSLFFTALTTAFLVIDLERPERFLRIVLQPQWKSWLVRGAFLLIGFSTISGIWWAIEAAIFLDLIDWRMVQDFRLPLLAASGTTAIGAAIYTAFLFGQAEGRDLWQTPLLPIHLIVQAMMAGSAAAWAVGFFTGAPDSWMRLAEWFVLGSVITDAFMLLAGEFGMSHASEIAAAAAKKITKGHYKTSFWWVAIGLGHVVPLALVFLGGPAVLGAAAAILIGLYAYEYAFVMAPQEIPNS